MNTEKKLLLLSAVLLLISSTIRLVISINHILAAGDDRD